MFGFYTPVLLLQAFCAYHAYRNNAENKWYWFILLFSVFGCAFYLYHHFYNRRNLTNIAESMKAVVNSNYRIEKLEQAWKFSDNLTNTINLADAYVDLGRYEEAISLYKSAATGFMADDPGIHMKLLQAHFLSTNYGEAVALGAQLESEKSFRNADERVAYAWALHYHGRSESAEQVFMSLDKSYTNYMHRLEYCKFLMQTGRTEDMQTKAAEILEEFENMRGPERKLHREFIHEVRAVYTSVPVK